MSKVWRDGAELGTLAELTGYTVGSQQVTNDSGTKRSGVYCYYIPRQYAGGSMYKTITALSEIYVRFAVYFSVNETVSDYFQLKSGATTQIGLALETTNRHFTLKVGSTTVATGSAVYNMYTWYVIELHATFSDAGGVAQLKVDGVLDINYTGDTKPSTPTTCNTLYWYVNTDDDGNGLRIDDIAVNSTEGDSDNSWCGDGRIILIRPGSDTGTLQLTPSTGTTHYTLVDEIPFNTTDYVSGSVVDEYDLYGLTSSGLSASSVVRWVKPVAYGADTVASGGKISVGIKTNGTEYWSDDVSLLTSYTSVSGSTYSLNPQTGLPWTLDELASLQIGVKIRGIS